MAHEVELRASVRVDLGSRDVVFRVREDDELVGTLMISRGGIEWRSAKHQYVSTTAWERFDDIAFKHFPTEVRKPTPRTRKRQRTQAKGRKRARR